MNNIFYKDKNRKYWGQCYGIEGLASACSVSNHMDAG